ncbi:unnamed protein product, partial [Aphanomyces euteiches]
RPSYQARCTKSRRWKSRVVNLQRPMKCKFQCLGAQRSIEMLEPCTVYEMLEEKAYDGVICHSNLIRKSYEEGDRHVILSRTVLRDALAPQMVQGDVEDESTWIVVESDEENPHQCFFTFLYHSQTDLSEISRPKPSNKENFITKVAMLKAQGQEFQLVSTA